MWLDYYVFATIFVFGAVIGSFLNVVIYRLHTGKSINGNSHCLSCGNRLRWFELFPIVSYLVLRGRCRSCGSYVPLRYLLVELGTAFSFVYLFSYTTDVALFVVFGTLIAVLMVAAVYDYYHLIIPNEIPLTIGVLAVLYHGYLLYNQSSSTDLFPVLVAVLIAGGGYAFLWFISKGRWVGFGDAKLAFTLGLFLPSAMSALSMVILSFWVGAAISLCLIGGQWLYARGQKSLSFPTSSITMKSEIPFAPFIILAFIFTFFFEVSVMESTTYALNWIF